METLNVVEARKNFSELMARVAHGGKRFLVERKGRPMMALVSVEDLRRLEALEHSGEEKRRRGEAALRAAAESRVRIRAERKGVPLSDSDELLARLRDERLE